MRIIIVVIIIISTFVSCYVEKENEKPFTCMTWCGNDIDNAVEVTIQATDSSDAQATVFETLGGTCNGGMLRKATCEAAE